MLPRSPSLGSRPPLQMVANPYLENDISLTQRHVSLREPLPSGSPGVVNGYLKFVIRQNHPKDIEEPRPTTARLIKDMAVHHRDVHVSDAIQADNVARLPPGYGSNAKLDATDRKLLRFCKSPKLTCLGRIS